ncbi:hypothetical protein BSZ39_04055 [Bowdeniella nasicola]|uniref:YegS/DAGK C-terminal domain-containing protein n=1 Tax=Bowdeniella nasicola TaxID=208480 RepID=A0A1Q5Q3V3_9ACTO|nr:hypothetical protein [Bowdeniella nasicola]OKL54481.1 hypothetical protein BSZ39_04055 [Bowdeniella nasicola]
MTALLSSTTTPLHHYEGLNYAKDGIGELITVSDVYRSTLLTVFPRIYRGTHISHPAVAHTRAKHFEISCSADVIVHGDGEALGSMPVSVTVEPAALRVLAAKAEWTSFDG